MAGVLELSNETQTTLQRTEEDSQSPAPGLYTVSSDALGSQMHISWWGYGYVCPKAFRRKDTGIYPKQTRWQALKCYLINSQSTLPSFLNTRL